MTTGVRVEFDIGTSCLEQISPFDRPIKGGRGVFWRVKDQDCGQWPGAQFFGEEFVLESGRADHDPPESVGMSKADIAGQVSTLRESEQDRPSMIDGAVVPLDLIENGDEVCFTAIQLIVEPIGITEIDVPTMPFSDGGSVTHLEEIGTLGKERSVTSRW